MLLETKVGQNRPVTISAITIVELKTLQKYKAHQHFTISDIFLEQKIIRLIRIILNRATFC